MTREYTCHPNWEKFHNKVAVKTARLHTGHVEGTRQSKKKTGEKRWRSSEKKITPPCVKGDSLAHLY